MEIVYLDTTAQDFDWLSHYYSAIFSQGWANMEAQIAALEPILSNNPFLGRPCEDLEGLRELNITKTPFTMIYRVTEIRIEVLRIWDQRQDRSRLRID